MTGRGMTSGTLRRFREVQARRQADRAEEQRRLRGFRPGDRELQDAETPETER